MTTMIKVKAASYSRYLLLISMPIWVSITLYMGSQNLFAQSIRNPNAVSLYGVSTHRDDNDGSGYNERNLGIAFKWFVETHTEKISSNFELGVFENSYYDTAFWVAFGINVELNQWLDAGINIRHWETIKGTYEKRIFVPYPVLKLKLKEQVSANILFRNSGNIAFLEYEF